MVDRPRRRSVAQSLQWVVQQVLLYAGMVLGLALFCIPLLYMVTTSFKTENQVFAIPIQWLPRPFSPTNYPAAFGVAPFATYFFNSTFVALATVAITLFFCTIAGYGLARYTFPGRQLIFLFILSTLMIPFQVIVIPLYVVVYRLGWTNSYLGLIIPGSVSAFGVFLMRQFSLTLPDDLMDAARIDGAGEFTILWRVAVPMLRPALATLALLTFIGSWNDFLWPLLVVTKNSLFTLPVGMTVFTQPLRQPYWTYIMAVSTVATLPVVLVFVALQRYFIQGVVLSGMKG